MEYNYQARDREGNLRTGVVEAVSEAGAFDILSQHGLIVIKVLPAVAGGIFSQIKIFDHVSPKEVVLFSRQFATLIDAKVPIVQALKILQSQVSSAKLKSIIGELAQRVESGDSVSSALARFPKVFSDLYINLIRSGELSGTMGEALNYLANQLEKDYDLRSKVIGSLTYPAFIVSTLFVVGFLMFLFVLPPLIEILTQADVELPITTKILIGTTHILQNFWWLIIALLLGVIIGLRVYIQTAGGRYIFDNTKLRLPVLGKLFTRIYMARFARNLSTLIAGGIPIVKALESVADIVGNEVYREIIFDAAADVRNGKGVATALVERPEFPPIVAQMIQIGEQTGRLQDILDKLATFYEKEVEGVLKVLTTLLEPIVMILLGVAVAIMVAGILLPIYNLSSAT